MFLYIYNVSSYLFIIDAIEEQNVAFAFNDTLMGVKPIISNPAFSS